MGTGTGTGTGTGRNVKERLVLRWFHARFGMEARFPVGSSVVVAGKLRLARGQAEMANPEVIAVEAAGGAAPGEAAGKPARGIRPRYPEVDGVAGAVVRKIALAAARKVAPLARDGIPAAVAARQGLPPAGDALLLLHDPPETLEGDALEALLGLASPAHRRLAFEELFYLQLGLLERRARAAADPAPVCAPPAEAMSKLRATLPFKLTGAQEAAIAELARDLAAPRPMQRLLQGDVGAGKTAVAFAGAHLAASAGRQVALMAPTELLAEQHLATLAPWAAALGHRVTLLTASTPRPVRESQLALIAAGVTRIVVGTHALLADRVAFHDLALAIVDEQHRFGVAQRARLRDKGGAGAAAPHLLVMTATPIPRTLALTAYGDLDLTILGELPPGRTPARTHVAWGDAGRVKADALIAREARAGHQAFVVCPQIDPGQGPDDDLVEGARTRAHVGATHARLAKNPDLRVGLVHGRLPANEREDVMGRFSRGELDVLVATTVIEVGVDIPRATVMVVEDAERFGLSQLHQLRGRVGRGQGQTPYCILCTSVGSSSPAADRLRVLAGSSDGFAIAEADLAIRGPGELFGTKQAGLPRILYGDLQRHAELIVAARREAELVRAEDPTLALAKHAGLARAMAERAAKVKLYAEEAG